jgi:hypothetical protein
MVPETASCLVGLITIEPIPSQRIGDSTPPGDHPDATLDQFLLYLARSGVCQRGEQVELAGEIAVCEPGSIRLPGGRFDSAASSSWPRPTRLSADLKTLAAQLELAVVQARRQVAVARRLGG